MFVTSSQHNNVQVTITVRVWTSPLQGREFYFIHWGLLVEGNRSEKSLNSNGEVNCRELARRPWSTRRGKPSRKIALNSNRKVNCRELARRPWVKPSRKIALNSNGEVNYRELARRPWVDHIPSARTTFIIPPILCKVSWTTEWLSLPFSSARHVAPLFKSIVSKLSKTFHHDHQ